MATNQQLNKVVDAAEAVLTEWREYDKEGSTVEPDELRRRMDVLGSSLTEYRRQPLPGRVNPR